MNENVESKVIESILEAGVDFTVTVSKPSPLHKLFPKLFPSERVFVIRPINLGTLLKISKCVMKIKQFDIDSSAKAQELFGLTLESLAENGDVFVEIIAYAITNSPKDPTTSLKKFLKENLSTKDMLRLLTVIVNQMNINDFLACIVSTRGMNIVGARVVQDSISGKASEAS